MCQQQTHPREFQVGPGKRCLGMLEKGLSCAGKNPSKAGGTQAPARSPWQQHPGMGWEGLGHRGSNVGRGHEGSCRGAGARRGERTPLRDPECPVLCGAGASSWGTDPLTAGAPIHSLLGSKHRVGLGRPEVSAPIFKKSSEKAADRLWAGTELWQ